MSSRIRQQVLATLQAAAIRTMFSALARVAEEDCIPRETLRIVPDGVILAKAYRIVGNETLWRRLTRTVSVIEVLEEDALFLEEAPGNINQAFSIQPELSRAQFCQCFTPEAFHEELRKLLMFNVAVYLEPESELLQSSMEETKAGSL